MSTKGGKSQPKIETLRQLQSTLNTEFILFQNELLNEFGITIENMRILEELECRPKYRTLKKNQHRASMFQVRRFRDENQRLYQIQLTVHMQRMGDKGPYCFFNAHGHFSDHSSKINWNRINSDVGSVLRQ